MLARDSIIIISGMTIFTAAKASAPRYRPTKMPSTMAYRPPASEVAMAGRAQWKNSLVGGILEKISECMQSPLTARAYKKARALQKYRIRAHPTPYPTGGLQENLPAIPRATAHCPPVTNILADILPSILYCVKLIYPDASILSVLSLRSPKRLLRQCTSAAH